MNHCNCIFQCGTYVSLWTYPWTKYEFCISRELQKERSIAIDTKQGLFGLLNTKAFLCPSVLWLQERGFIQPSWPSLSSNRHIQAVVNREGKWRDARQGRNSHQEQQSTLGARPGSEEGIHRAWTPSQACLCWSCVATSPVDSELCA